MNNCVLITCLIFTCLFSQKAISNNWMLINSTTYGYQNNKMFWDNPNNGAVLQSLLESYKLIITNDAGNHWKNIDIDSLRTELNISSSSLVNLEYLIGDTIKLITSDNYKIITYDRGVNWEKVIEQNNRIIFKPCSDIGIIQYEENKEIGKNGAIINKKFEEIYKFSNTTNYEINPLKLTIIDEKSFFFIESKDIHSWPELIMFESGEFSIVKLPKSQYFPKVEIISPSLAYCATSYDAETRVYKSIDGMITWELVYSAYLDSHPYLFSMFNNQLGYMYANKFLKTNDGGKTWFQESFFDGVCIDILLTKSFSYILTSGNIYRNDEVSSIKVAALLNNNTYPSPAFRGTNVKINCLDNSFNKLTLYDYLGHTIDIKTICIFNHIYEYTLPNTLNKGLYMIRLSNGNDFFDSKLIIL